MNNQQEMNVNADHDQYAFDLPVTMDTIIEVLNQLIEASNYQSEQLERITNVLGQNLQRPELKSETNINTPDTDKKFVTEEICMNYQEFVKWLLQGYGRMLTAANRDILHNIKSLNLLTQKQCRLIYAISANLATQLKPESKNKVLKNLKACGYIGD